MRAGRYEEAEKVRLKAELLEEYERRKLEADFSEITERKESQILKKQQLALGALLKRIQRDRNE